ncbi:MAG: bacteriocin class II family protein [Bacteroides sp.]|nr:bacteriocin class II family protein [Bacteroides sp.]
MKIRNILFIALYTPLLFSCAEDVNVGTVQQRQEQLVNNQELMAQTEDVRKLEQLLYSKKFGSYDLACDYFTSFANESRAVTDSENIHLSDEGWDVFEKKMTKADLSKCENLASMRKVLMDILTNSSLSEYSSEYIAFEMGIDISITVYNYRLSFEPQSRGVWDTITEYAKCIAGTAGSAGLGILTGAGVGTVTLPVIGTVSGAALGGYSGALVGAATFC